VNTPSKIIRVLVADDHPVTRKGIRTILEEAPDIEIIGEARDGVEAKQMVGELRPDVLLLDLVMPGLRPSKIEEWVRTNHPQTVTLVLTAHDRDYFLTKAIDAGVAGYLTKTEAPHGLIEAIRRAVKGEVLITGGQLARVSRWRMEVGERWEGLTRREREVLELVAQGLGNQEIAQTLSVTKKTVEKHVSNALGKMGLSSRTEAAVWVARNIAGMVEESLPEK